MRKYLYCAAKGHDGHWQAICLDLDIAVEGESFEDVQERLIGAICAYIDSAMEKPEHVRDQLLSRRAPFLVRMRWMLPVLFATIFRRKGGGDDSPAMFSAACPA